MVTTFKDKPLAFYEDPSGEYARLERLQSEDPIALQEIFNTSAALVDAVRASDLEELQSVVANAEEGEFLQAFVLQSLVVACRNASLEIVKELVNLGIPLEHEQLAQVLHLVCEVTNRDNFGNTWRIVQLLISGNAESRLDINTPRVMDGWTPLCVACADACLPLCFKLLELQADPNVITRKNDTPISLVKQRHKSDTEEQKEARGIIVNMLRSYGAQASWRDALASTKQPKRPPVKQPSVATTLDDGKELVSQKIGQSHTRFAA